jgi:hypothetical protein
MGGHIFSHRGARGGSEKEETKEALEGDYMD